MASAWKSTPLLASVVFLLVVALMGILAPVIAPHSQYQGSLRERNMPPAWLAGGSTEHLLGTDRLGRDVLSRLIYGARTTLTFTAVPVLVAGLIGISLGITAGYFGPRINVLDFRLTELPLVLFAILPLLLAQFSVSLSLLVAPVTVGSPGLWILMTITTMLAAVIFAHQAWRETLSVEDEDTVRQVQEAGNGHFRIIVYHVFPGVAHSLLALAPLLMLYLMAYAIVLGPTLSFRGLGSPPSSPAWGLMMAQGRDGLIDAWWIFALPTLAILLTVFFLSLLANQLRDHSNVVLRIGGVNAVRPGVLLATLLVAVLAVGMTVGPSLSQGFIYPLAWLVGTAIVWQGYQRYGLPGSKAILIGFALLLFSALIKTLVNLVLLAAVLLTAGDLAGFVYSREGLSLFGPVTGLPGLAESPYERTYNDYLVPAIGLPMLVGALLIAYGLWAMRKVTTLRPAGGG